MTKRIWLIAILLIIIPVARGSASQAQNTSKVKVEIPPKVIYALQVGTDDGDGTFKDAPLDLLGSGNFNALLEWYKQTYPTQIVEGKFLLLPWGGPNPFYPGEWFFQNKVSLRKEGSVLTSSDVFPEDYLQWTKLAPKFSSDCAKVATIDGEGNITIHSEGTITFAVILSDRKPITQKVKVVILPLITRLSLLGDSTLRMKDVINELGPPTTTKTMKHYTPDTVSVYKRNPNTYEFSYEESSFSSITFLTYAKYPGLQLAFDCIGGLEGTIFTEK